MFPFSFSFFLVRAAGCGVRRVGRPPGGGGDREAVPGCDPQAQPAKKHSRPRHRVAGQARDEVGLLRREGQN